MGKRGKHQNVSLGRVIPKGKRKSEGLENLITACMGQLGLMKKGGGTDLSGLRGGNGEGRGITVKKTG